MKNIQQDNREIKILAVYSGGDWTDSSCNHLVLLKDIDLDKERENHNNWYENKYLPRLRKDLDPIYYTFSEWLIKKGFARKVKNNELQEYWEI